MSDKADEKEVWKQYPDYDFIEVSNLGRVRTKDRYVPYKGSKRLIKGRVLKRQLKKSGYMQVTFKVNGKNIYLLVHRAVAICFLPNPDNLLEVNHIDCDRTNNRVDNLEWCTSQYNSAYRDKLGHFVNNNPGHPVFAVNLKTVKILRFESQSEAARQLGISQGNIYNVLKGKQIQAGGYWFTEDKSEITEKKIREIRASMKSCQVIAFNPETSEVFCFESQREASRQLGADQGHISDVLRGRYKKTHGYWFCYADEKAVDKVRAKFGDEIAKKVEELIKQNQN